MEPIQDKKTMLFESALELIREHGFHGTPVSRVARHAGVASGTVYTYFKSKDEMILELYKYVKIKVMAEVSAKDSPELPFQHRFFAFWDNLTSLYLTKPAFQSFMEQFVSSPYNTPELQRSTDLWGAWLGKFFGEGVKEGALRPLSPQILAVMVIGNVISLVRYLTYFKSQTQSMKGELKQIPQMVWDGIKNQ
ncbi:TetR/AcrR family transcriptional regulator [Cyclobacterium jeungdonense]|uniref:TetR/AcrR family transcriptional regulator n=1 Tax=Cyclobacterium jeungdonense TaxID=708087 RepID=A0ABT8C6V6_9BACT|nr:TetR/AcrR family transcriptional regulator [Cyclobacterium jeungdonense]MDN3688495.1 TetR/AcrR family transcriptional regulator [Cyclobacterium jeungdonense]